MSKKKLFALAILVCCALDVARAAGEAPSRRVKPPKDNRCATYGEGFIYSRSADSCIRIGGSVSTQFSTGTPSWPTGQ